MKMKKKPNLKFNELNQTKLKYKPKYQTNKQTINSKIGLIYFVIRVLLLLVAALRGVAIQRTRLTRSNTLAATFTRHSSPLTAAATLHGYAASQ